MRILIAVSAGLLLTACVSIDTTNKTRVVSTEKQVETATAVGETRTTTLGETMVSVRSYTATTASAEAMEVSEAFRLTGYEDRDFVKGEKLAIIGERKIDGQTYTIARPRDWFVGLQIAPDGSITPALINTDIEMVWKVTATPNTVRLKRVPVSATTTSGSGPNYDLAYNGLDGQSMKFQFRQYKADDLDRPTLSQDFAFPVGTKSVTFKGIGVDIQDATPTSIRYTVTSLMPVMISPASN